MASYRHIPVAAGLGPELATVKLHSAGPCPTEPSLVVHEPRPHERKVPGQYLNVIGHHWCTPMRLR